jgi:hypothetical protein
MSPVNLKMDIPKLVSGSRWSLQLRCAGFFVQAAGTLDALLLWDQPLPMMLGVCGFRSVVGRCPGGGMRVSMSRVCLVAKWDTFECSRPLHGSTIGCGVFDNARPIFISF